MPILVPPGEPALRPSKRRVLIVDDHIFFAACLRTLLDAESDLIVCDVVARCTDLDERVRRLEPDLLVIDLTLGMENGMEIARRLRDLRVVTPILFVSTLVRPTPEQLAGIAHCAFIPKDRKPARFLAALREVLAQRARTGDTERAAITLTKAIEPA